MESAGDAPWTGLPGGTVIGHVHLHVGDIGEGSAFFSAALGFDRITWSYPGALFLSAGGYHHHLGTNTWSGAGARPPAAGDAQLLEWTIVLPTTADVDAAVRSVEAAGYPPSRDGSDALLTDPWGTRVRLRVAGATGAP